MGVIEREFANALSENRVRRKANNTRKIRVAKAKAERVASGAPEVMVKVTGFGKGAAHVKSHLDYISRNGKIELENDRGEVLKGKADVYELFSDWKQNFNGGAGRNNPTNQRDTMHLVLSMPPTTDPEAVRSAVREFTKANFGANHQYVFALHTDEQHPHCHVTVKCLGFDGKRLQVTKEAVQAWRESFAEEMRGQGWDAEATPRRSRGVVQKAEKQVVRHIERGDKTHEPRTPKIKAAKIKEAADELSAEAAGQPAAQRPWEGKIKASQTAIRRAWLTAANALEHEAPAQPDTNRREQHNAKPDYTNSNPAQERANQLAAALYQSNLEKSGRKAASAAVASMRNVPRLGVVHHQGRTQMLLLKNAPGRLAEVGDTDTGVRRAGAGHPGHARGRERVAGSPSDGKTLAGRIKAFVAAMPKIDTERHEIKRALQGQYARQPVLGNPPALATVAPPVSQEQKKGADRAAPKQGGEKPDVER